MAPSCCPRPCDPTWAGSTASSRRNEFPVISTVRKTVATRFPHLRGKRVLVAASGGADSTALALALKDLGCDIALAHVHHGIRGKTAAADARFVAALAKKLGAPFFLGKFDVPAEAKKSGESLEMAARRVRRDFLAATAKREQIRFVATGHTADDQAETVLMRIARGTSISGLAGIPYVSKHGGATFVRPLRDAARAQIVAFLESRRQPWREDESNAEDFALRNRVRHEILPLLEKRLNPAVRQALLRLADIAAAEDAVMSALAKTAKRGGKEPLALRRRRALAELRSAGVPPEKQVFHAVEKSFPRCGKKRPIFPQCGKKFSIAWKNRGKVFHCVEKPDVPGRDPHGLASWVNEIAVPRRVEGAKLVHPPRKGVGVQENHSLRKGVGVPANHSLRKGVGGQESHPPRKGVGGQEHHPPRKGGGGRSRPRSPTPQESGGLKAEIRFGRGFSRRADEVCLSAAAVGGRDLVFRSWRAGDRMKPLGMAGSKKLSDIFTDLKVLREERNARIVVECGGVIAALAGWRVSRDFAVEGPRAESIRIRI
ncbi:MAG: tRNA lysidine(34) synthetase TilS [Opitutae bacterium]|nr:tRNA lysidine(34) synthetase TilS [Opitutae bacterium]